MKQAWSAMVRMLPALALGCLLLACGVFTGTDEPTRPEVMVAYVPDPPDRTTIGAALPVLFHGDTLVEEKIINSPVVVTATMTSFSSEVVASASNTHRVVLKFNLSVSEYLKGTGPSAIIAVWVDGHSYATHPEATARKAAILAERDAQWDDREAVIFLHGDATGFGTTLDTQLQLSDHFLLYVGDPYSSDDFYSLHSREHKRWLPAATISSPVASSSSDDKEFLLDVPTASTGAAGASSTPTTPTITLSTLKKRVKDVTAEFNGGDGSEEYKTCVREKYESERMIRYFQALDGTTGYEEWAIASNLKSGQPANTVVHTRENSGNYPSQKAKTWFEGTDAGLFTVVQGKTTPYDLDGDGKFTAAADAITFTESFQAVRPLPAGTYTINRKEVEHRNLPCNYTLSHTWTITVTAPANTMHEAFFDPVAGVSIGGGSPVLASPKPRAFTGAGGVSANLAQIAYTPPSKGTGKGQTAHTVTMTLNPVTALAGQTVDFIKLDGTVGLSLNVASATVDTSRNTLRWTVSSAPWKSGDKLMVRIRQAPAATPTPTPAPKATPTPRGKR